MLDIVLDKPVYKSLLLFRNVIFLSFSSLNELITWKSTSMGYNLISCHNISFTNCDFLRTRVMLLLVRERHKRWNNLRVLGYSLLCNKISQLIIFPVVLTFIFPSSKIYHGDIYNNMISLNVFVHYYQVNYDAAACYYTTFLRQIFFIFHTQTICIIFPKLSLNILLQFM